VRSSIPATSWAVVFAATVLGGCAIMPSHGPEGHVVGQNAALRVNEPVQPERGAQSIAQPYVLVTVDNRVLSKMDNPLEQRFAGVLTDRRGPVGLRLGVGDIVSVSIFEAAAGGLFSPPAASNAARGNSAELPPQTIGRDGTLNVPFAGAVPAAGYTPSDIERTIAARLRNRAIEPQVILTIREQRSAQVSVLGEVLAPAKFTLNPQGERVLDVIARAGGSKFPAYETIVAIQRSGRRAQVSLTTLLRDPKNNIFAQPGDTIFVSREQRHFVALGAQGQNGLFFFDSERVTLSYAMGKAGGLLDERAEPAFVFVYRTETRKQLEKYGADLANPSHHVIPVVYQINLRDPSGMLLAQNFVMRDRDLIFVANSPTVDIAKFLQLVRIGLNAGRDGVELGRAILTPIPR
jgi:polysaccharide export outer membrane protein